MSWNEIRDRANAFARDWKDESSEDAEAKSFWDAFFHVFGITRRRVASFETPVTKSDGRGGFIDLLWKGILLVEHKSRGRDLDRAFHQATGYFPGLREADLPKYIVVSDFARFRLYTLDPPPGNEDDAQPVHDFALEDLPANIHLFGFIAGYATRPIRQQDPVNVQAAEKLGRLHDLLLDEGYDGHALELFLVRILFCLFAEDNGIFERQQFREWIESNGNEDFTILGIGLAQLFQVLHEAPEKRSKNLSERLTAFRYINGKLFEKPIPIATFSRLMCDVLLDCTTLDWSRISPAIFGALFQSIMDKKARRNLGAHYTSETNILKALEPLFLDSLRAEFNRIRHDRRRLETFHHKLAGIRILDPACGCGNFLVIAYRELRLLELEVLRSLFPEPREGRLDVSGIVFVDVDQFYGIEIEEFPAQIAQVALWMTDHQMNQRVSAEFGQYFVRLPLKKAPSILHANALQLDWTKVIAPKDLSYIVGNPPFVGKAMQSISQKSDLKATFKDTKAGGVLDYVAAWYRKAVDYMAENNDVETAFVSTNSITQGEQVGALWPRLLERGIYIRFAHRTFEWSSEARGKAAVHCVIVGFSFRLPSERFLYEYDHVKSTPRARQAANINPYLVDAASIFLRNRSSPVTSAPRMVYGSKPADGSKAELGIKELKRGNLILTDQERKLLVKEDPQVRRWLRRFVGSVEFINGNQRWCLWLDGVPPQEIRSSPQVMRRIELVRDFRLRSKKAPTRAAAANPSLFTEIRQPNSDYLAVPEVSSERRVYIPIAFLPERTIASNLLYTVPNATVFDFGVITSLMHMAWVRTICGRLKSDYRYSAGIVYNNFPWPDPTPKQRAAIETAAQAVLDQRKLHPTSTLADLYDPLSMPPGLVKAHGTLDRAVDAAYGKTSFPTEAERVAFLFTLYEKLTSLFPAPQKPKRRPRNPAA